ncbi:phage tail protein [Streptomyces cucumeris]|uniref:phage tail protein n=1 Tax=Streptomyces cucumeris TaxID=2962890 RepID=UPI0020C8D79D|nr:phage tail protein [Streptomyces sp. NEAU-Y11]MCP9213163.1 phage tail protein [Streptomyces sp. NEAU-Y11]
MRDSINFSDSFFGSVSMTHSFTVAIDRCEYELGDWASASGLYVTWPTCEYRSGDNWNHPLVYPGVPQYQRVKLSRAACGDSQIVQEWLTETSVRNEPLTGAIALVNWAGVPTVTWELKEFFPVAWGINEFSGADGRVALESLELVHTGFLNDDFAPHNPTASVGNGHAGSSRTHVR